MAGVATNSNAQALVANAGNMQTICPFTSVTIGGNPTATGGVPGYTYLWSPSMGLSATGIANPSASPMVTTTYTVTVSDNNGGTATSSVIVAVAQMPLVSNAVMTQVICSGGTATFVPTSNVIGTMFSYSASASSGSISGYSANGMGNIVEVLTNSGTTSGTVTYTYTPIGPPPSNCIGPPANFVVTIDPAPTTASAGNNQTICGTSTAMAGNTALVGSGMWTLISGAGTITTPTSPTSGVTGIGVGPNVFQWTISSVNCGASSSQVTIIGSPPPTVANAGADQYVFCNTAATMAGNTAAVGIGTWTLVSGSGIITNPLLETSGVTNLGPGNNVFQWTITNPPCPPTSSQVTITVCLNVGVDETDLSNTITIFPNPFTSQITITSTKYEVQSIKIVNVLGKEVIGHLSLVNGKSITIDLNDVSNGIYFVQVGNTFRKIIKQ